MVISLCCPLRSYGNWRSHRVAVGCSLSNGEGRALDTAEEERACCPGLGWGHGRKTSLNCHPFRAQQAHKAILALENTNGMGGSGWLTLAPYPAPVVLTHCLPVSFHSRVKGTASRL